MKEINLKINVDGAEKVQQVNKEVQKTSGNAKKANKGFKDLAKESGVLSKEMSVLNRIQGVYNTALTAMGLNTAKATAGTSGLTRTLGTLRIALIKTGIGAIAVAVGTLAAAFVSTQEGADRVNRALAPLTMMMQRLWGIIQEFALDFVQMWEDPQQAIRDIGQLILDNILNRLRAIPDAGMAAFKILQGSVKTFSASARIALGSVPIIGRGIDMDQAREDLKEAADIVKEGTQDMLSSVQQFTTGVEGGLSKLWNATKDLYDDVKQDAQLLFDLERELQIRRTESLVPLARMRREYEEQRTLANDVSLTAEEQLEAIARALELQRQITEEETAQLDMEIEILRIKQAQNDTSREEDMELQRLLARREELESQAERQNRNLTRRQSTVREQIRKTAEEEAEAARLAEEERRALQEERERLDALAAEDRIMREREINNRLRELDAEDYEQQLEIEAERAEIERDKKLLEMEREIEDEELLAQEKALINAEFQERLNQIEADGASRREAIARAELAMRYAIADEVANILQSLARLAGEQTQVGKALGIAQATIDTYVGANKALAQGGILGPVAAAAVVAAGLANVRQILSTQVPSIQGQPMGTPASAPPVRAVQAEPEGIGVVETVFNQDEQTQKVVVVESDITETQDRVRVIEEGSEF